MLSRYCGPPGGMGGMGGMGAELLHAAAGGFLPPPAERTFVRPFHCSFLACGRRVAVVDAAATFPIPAVARAAQALVVVDVGRRLGAHRLSVVSFCTDASFALRGLVLARGVLGLLLRRGLAALCDAAPRTMLPPR